MKANVFSRSRRPSPSLPFGRLCPCCGISQADPLPTLETAGAVAGESSIATKLAESVAYAGLRPFSEEEKGLPCVRKAKTLAEKLDGIAKDSSEAQAMYDHDPESDVGKEAEKNIKTLEFLAAQVAKFYHKVTTSCANYIATHRSARYAVEVNRTTAKERDERNRIKKRYRKSTRTAQNERGAEEDLHESRRTRGRRRQGARRRQERHPHRPDAPPPHGRTRTRREEGHQVAEQSMKDPSNGKAGALFAKDEEGAKKAAEESHKARVKASAEENAKLALKEHLTDAVASKLKAAREAYDKHQDRQASEQLRKISLEKRFEVPSHSDQKDTDALVCDQHLHDRLVRLQRLVGRTASHVQSVTSTIETLHGKHLAEITMLVATVRAQEAARKHLQDVVQLFKSGSSAIAATRFRASRFALETAGLKIAGIQTTPSVPPYPSFMASNLPSMRTVES